jgi:L-arabinokinase
MEPALVYYITAHGYGHGVRSCDILRAFHRLYPQTPITVVTDLSPSFIRNRLPDVPLTIRSGVFDVGMVQLDSVRVDVPATLIEAINLLKMRPQRIEQEAQFLTSHPVGLVACDIPALPIEAARRVGIPAVGIGNFTWNWIYEPFAEQDPRWSTIIAAFEEGYRQSDLLLRLPFAEPMSAFPRQLDLPVVASPGQSRRADLMAHTGAPPDRKWVLLSFSTLNWDEAALHAIEALQDYAFFTVLPLAWKRSNIFPIDREVISYTDAMASCDAVITKPGFGVVSECVVNRKPMVYVDRDDFREYPVLEAAVQRYIASQHLPAVDLYAGRIGAALHAVWQTPWPTETPGVGGAEIAAHNLAAFI